MSDKKASCEISYLPFHINARTNNKEHFQIDLRDCWDIFVDHLLELHYMFGVRIHAFALMSNHYHLLACFPERTRAECMHWFQMMLAKAINKKSGRINHLWGGPYHGSLITSARYYQYALKYIYRNPVDAGLCLRPEDYEYSSLRGSLGLSKYEIPLCPSKPWLEGPIPKDLKSYLSWLNHDFPNGFEEFYITAWKKKEMKFNTRMARTLRIEDIEL